MGSRPMDYYKILNFQKEPFSNSPDPEFFFQSSQHLGCLQRLEIAVRLRRGLSVVIGDVGTGKTTLCRQIIVRFSNSEEDKEHVIPYLILDPTFSTPLEFLANVAVTFGLSAAEDNPSEWQYKEIIKNYLYEKGVDEGKIVVLIIDEGQKLPQFCLEILREFLNYETNEHKLLQIIIFAQNEFEQVLKERANLADRVNEHYFLKPLNFKETREMVKFRIKKASGENKAISLFTFLGLWAIYKATGGYPRKIVILCHQAILTLIIQNRHKAGWSLIRSCVLRGNGEKPSRLRWVIPVVVLLFVAVSIFAGSSSIRVNLWKNVGKNAVTNKNAETNPTVPPLGNEGISIMPIKNEEIPSTSPPLEKGGEGGFEVPANPPSQEKKYALLGQLTVTKKEPVWLMINRFYGGINANMHRLEAVIRANPQIKDFDNVEVGEKINFPARPLKVSPLPAGRFWVQLSERKSLEDAYKLLENYPANYPPVRLVPYKNRTQGAVFTIILQDSFINESTAVNSIRHLPPPLNSNAKVLSVFEEGTIFF